MTRVVLNIESDFKFGNPSGCIAECANLSITVFRHFCEAVIVIVELSFVAIRENLSKYLPSCCEALYHFVFCDAVTATTDSVLNASKAFCDCIQTNVIQSYMIA